MIRRYLPKALRERYDSDLSDEEWNLVKDLIPLPQSNSITGGRPAKYNRRDILNGILYVARTGCQWRLLPHDFPKWKTIYDYFVLWHDAGIFEAINARLRKDARLLAGRNPDPTAGIIDSQSVKIVANIGYSGFDGAKKVNGRKRHIVTDTLGLLLHVVVHDASIPDRIAARKVLSEVAMLYEKIRMIFADQGYTGTLIEFVKNSFSITLSIIKRSEVRVFKLLPRRWVVERTFGWFGFYRRLAKDYERYPTHSEAFVYIAMSNIMLRRLARGF
jgi:putative transposase